MKEHNDAGNQPVMVTIQCIAYNHEPYIRDCLDGFVMQKTDFCFEAIVHDDASTDGTASIIMDYAKRYPDIIKPIIETENQYSKGDGSLGRIMNNASTGKYIALCEGDDYWIDPLKLQKQVDYLESHPDCSAVFGNGLGDKNGVLSKRKYPKHKYGMFEVMSAFMPGIQNICVRRETLVKKLEGTFKSNSDMILYHKCALDGYLWHMDEDFAVYRWTGQGVATSRNEHEWMEAYYRDFYNFHGELGFKYNRALAALQSRITIDFLIHHHTKKDIADTCRRLRTYSRPEFTFKLWRLYYYMVFVLKTGYYFVTGKSKVYSKI